MRISDWSSDVCSSDLRNYGWPVITYGIDYSGEKIGIGSAAPGMEQPLLHWTPSIAPSGMAFYTGGKIPAWTGSLFVGSLKFGSLHRVVLDGTRVGARSEERRVGKGRVRTGRSRGEQD